MIKRTTITILLLFVLTNVIQSQWQKLNNDAFTGDIRALITTGNSLYAGTNNGGVYFSAASDGNWEQRNNGLTNNKVYSLAYKENKLAAGTYGNGVFLSNDGGNSWQATASGITVPFIYAVGLLGHNIIAGTGGGGFFRSENNGANWVYAGGTTHIVNSIFVGEAIAYMGQGPYAYKSVDNGVTWTTLIGSSNTTIKGFAESKTASGGNNICVATLDGVFVSIDNGVNWKNNYSGNVNGIVSRENHVFAGLENTFGGGAVAVSSDNGITWKNEDAGLPSNINVRAITIDSQFLYIGSGDGFVWKRNLSDFGITTDIEDEFVPLSFELFQNYPNPFNPSTTIKYSISQYGNVNLKIYDLLGKEIITLINEEKPAGVYEIEFDGTNLSSGVYFYRLQTGAFSKTMKLNLIK